MSLENGIHQLESRPKRWVNIRLRSRLRTSDPISLHPLAANIVIAISLLVFAAQIERHLLYINSQMVH